MRHFARPVGLAAVAVSVRRAGADLPACPATAPGCGSTPGDIAALQDGEQVQAQVALVSAQACLTYVQAGYTRESAMAAVEAGDVSLLVPDPLAVLAPARADDGAAHAAAGAARRDR